jgi:cell filamentation protein, protein adenylyltransferase
MKPFVAERLPLTGIDWPSLVPLIGQANRALALYDGILYGVPNPEVLLSPLTTQEAVLSSRMEGTQATLGDVLKFEAGAEVAEESKRQDIQEIINYRRALQTAEEELKKRPFNLNLLLDLHSILLDSVRGRNKARGQFRTEQNWIGPPGSTIEEARFVPPAPLFLKNHLDNWEKYYHGEERDPLVQLAIVHAQFEIIHPFLDGNGRLGRILVPLFLHEKQLLSRPMFYISSYLEANRDEYVDRLRDLGRPKSWDRWIDFFLRAVTEQAKANAATARSIIELYERLKTKLIELTHSRYAVPLLDHLFDQPIFQSSQLTRHRQMPSLPTVMQMLRRLRKAGILKTVRKGRGRRAEIFAFVELLNLCEGKRVM